MSARKTQDVNSEVVLLKTTKEEILKMLKSKNVIFVSDVALEYRKEPSNIKIKQVRNRKFSFESKKSAHLLLDIDSYKIAVKASKS